MPNIAPKVPRHAGISRWMGKLLTTLFPLYGLEIKLKR